MSETMRFNQGKPELSYILEAGVDALGIPADVLAKGKVKYDRGNWKNGGVNTTLESLLDSCARHLAARLDGQTHDPDMGTDHLGNAFCNLLFALYHHGLAPTLSVAEYERKLLESPGRESQTS